MRPSTIWNSGLSVEVGSGTVPSLAYAFSALAPSACHFSDHQGLCDTVGIRWEFRARQPYSPDRYSRKATTTIQGGSDRFYG